MLGLDKAWKRVTTAKQAQEAAKEMYRSMPQWKLSNCIKQLCGGTTNLIGAARASNVYFVSAEVAEAATSSLAELMGGVMVCLSHQRLRPLQ